MVLVSRTDQEQETMALVSYNMYRHSVIHGKGYTSECDIEYACSLKVTHNATLPLHKPKNICEPCGLN